MSYPRWSSGQPPTLSARGWNAAMAAAEAYEAQQRSQLVEGSRYESQRGVVLVKNKSGALCRRSYILGLRQPIVAPGEDINSLHEHLALEGCAPHLPCDRDQFAVVVDSLVDGEVGRAVLHGLVLVQVSINSLDHPFAHAKHADATQLESDTAGKGRILWKEHPESTGTQWCLVELGVGPATDAELEVTSTTSSTTTTPIPACEGECRWTWDTASQAWSLTSNGCSPATSTTAAPTSTSSTSEPATSTTESPCACPTTSTSTTAAPTTTTPAPCNCVYPRFCGSVDGDCTYTSCATGDVETEIPCTTSTSSTTSTTCDCNTTTTAVPDPGCAAGCEWVFLPVLGWQQTSNGCSGDCPCAAPSEPGSACGKAHTDCIPEPPPPPPPAPSCSGSCEYWWITGDNYWLLTENNCAGIGKPCYCVAPTYEGSDCGPVTVPCQSPTTTTAAPGPCASCYTSSTTSSSTTTPGPCERECTWRWDTSAWSLEETPCDPDCPCAAPPTTGHDSCELTRTRCGTQTTSTTSSTTTTPQMCASLGCTYVYQSGSWVLSEEFSSCDQGGPDCFCQPAETICFPCDPLEGQAFDTSCGCEGCFEGACGPGSCPEGSDCGGCTTTTSTTTSTTSSTTTPAPWHCMASVDCATEEHSCQQWEDWAPEHPAYCGGPYSSQAECEAACTTTGAPWYCATMDADCSQEFGPNTCTQDTEIYMTLCGGPYSSQAECTADCTTTTSTTPGPQWYCVGWSVEGCQALGHNCTLSSDPTADFPGLIYCGPYSSEEDCASGCGPGA